MTKLAATDSVRVVVGDDQAEGIITQVYPGGVLDLVVEVDEPEVVDTDVLPTTKKKAKGKKAKEVVADSFGPNLNSVQHFSLKNSNSAPTEPFWFCRDKREKLGADEEGTVTLLQV